MLGPIHTELLAIAMQKMDRISIISHALLKLMLSLRAQCDTCSILTARGGFEIQLKSFCCDNVIRHEFNHNIVGL